MALILSGQALTKSYGGRPLFSQISLELVDGERVGLIGPNGSGKSTLLKILAGLESPDEGARSLRKGARLGYVEQDARFQSDLTVERVLLDALAETQHDDSERHARVSAIVAKMSFPDREQPAGSLSGGWRKRLALARELVREPDVLLLDEPTNHLDIEGILWLERLLGSIASAVLLVSHDRYFLQNVTRRVVELNRCYPKGHFSAQGNYADFLARREEFLAGQAQQQSVLANKVRREIEWLKRGPPARTTKSAARIKKAGQLQGELAEVSYRNAQNRSVEVDFSGTGRQAKRLLVAKGLAKKLGGRQLFEGVDLMLSPGTKVGLVGPNGSGKTTLLKLLSGQLASDAGSIERADGLGSVVFDQEREQLNPDELLRNALSPNGENVLYQGRAMHVVAWAKRFLFEPEQLARNVGSLSGGEQARVMIARLMLQPADLLLLDEPTNDLDIASLEVLEESLIDFPGAIVLVTHDRYLLDRVTNVILALDGPQGAHTFANLAQWQASKAVVEPEVPGRRAAAPARKSTGRLSYNERRELDEMDEKIAQCEQALAEHEKRVADPQIASDHVRLRAACQQFESVRAELDRLYARWEELEAKRGG
jgi:ABC transport system ATP-binding/permease protein